MQLQSFFSGSHDLREIILKRLSLAEHSIFAAVAWFTDPILFNKLLEKLEEGVEVQLIITNHEFNKLNYSAIENRGGFFAEIGDDNQLMHNKFCIIDHNYILNGSFNWTRKANESNNENLTVISGDPMQANMFLEEFKKLKLLAGHVDDNKNQSGIDTALKTVRVIKTFIEIGDPQKAFPYAQEISNYEELKGVYDAIQLREYEKAIIGINHFTQKYSQVLNIGLIEREYIKSQIKLITSQIQAFEIEKTEIEALIDKFNHRYIIELNPLILKILTLKRKINEKLKAKGFNSEEFEQAERSYNEAMAELEEEMDNPIIELNLDEEKELKEIYRNSVKFCHPDSVDCLYEDKVEAANIFNRLTEAYKRSNLEQAKEISQLISQGKPISELDSLTELNFLRTRLVTLKAKLSSLIQVINEIKSSAQYNIIQTENDLDSYFVNKKNELKNQLDTLLQKFAWHEA